MFQKLSSELACGSNKITTMCRYCDCLDDIDMLFMFCKISLSEVLIVFELVLGIKILKIPFSDRLPSWSDRRLHLQLRLRQGRVEEINTYCLFVCHPVKLVKNLIEQLRVKKKQVIVVFFSFGFLLERILNMRSEIKNSDHINNLMTEISWKKSRSFLCTLRSVIKQN